MRDRLKSIGKIRKYSACLMQNKWSQTTLSAFLLHLFVCSAAQGCTIMPAQTQRLSVHFTEGFFNNYTLEQFHVIKEHIICYCNESWLELGSESLVNGSTALINVLKPRWDCACDEGPSSAPWLIIILITAGRRSRGRLQPTTSLQKRKAINEIHAGGIFSN